MTKKSRTNIGFWSGLLIGSSYLIISVIREFLYKPFSNDLNNYVIWFVGIMVVNYAAKKGIKAWEGKNGKI
jgi:hypothetical protein